ncbi:PEP-CTERM sorting domain-containing protein [Pontiella agarivorans]|uniref:PEP-CTERM sorting domain-containing protein n=1 Tax=Pontiella agarivorans TaxID=3038953 RepID=A0ABU5MWN3_9BACT|nr:PEP-CTERM sorting domain-containing protein [Pontiella agarivorans]MDZ8118361.1 PEP-CTERM sorting domain-containing protein [Pontiella agarivorans]
MKKQFITMAVFAAGIAHAGPFSPDWIDDSGSVYAEWSNWNYYNPGTVSAADEFGAYDYETGIRTDTVGSFGEADILSNAAGGPLSGHDYLDLWGTSDSLSFWMPTFSGFETTEVVIQLSYWDDESDDSWRAGFDLMPQLSDTSEGHIVNVTSDEYHDLNSELITEAWSFTVSGSTDGFFADFAYADDNTFIDSVSIDAVSYAVVPEPASVISMIFGGVILACTRRRLRR